ncbi:AAA family ATPase [Vibrio parahaemolyticus]|uniref:AAA family ATPase n=1 Tax=Vibrio parahaemolyticus TaxID=670 RepID=UPI0011212704|nr:AAA family ATPase [Vibrio parahaemolyticus]EIO5099442.1 AAA family ATPase [Vibrio parahaemolyticus]MDF4490285.1 AAA family ATPase [Vibrio parahaemolyticus]MDG3384863.1 AAA family ATPase [Vibrio parahaemolyticus]TOL27730.1 hypothetical protein CGI01_24330 [Vibrio parahaemolyticus]
MEAIRIRNLRSFIDNNDDSDDCIGFVDIKPITVFVGKNSCGKSTLLRTFPLLKQSIASNTTGPILWYGDYVDFGSFSQAISNRSSNEKIYFDFKTKIGNESQPIFFDDFNDTYTFNNNIKERNEIDITIKLAVIENKSISSTDRITIEIEGQKIKLNFSKSSISGISLNGESIELSSSSFVTMNTRGLLPRILDRDSDLGYFHHHEYSTINSQIKKSAKLLKSCFHSRTDIEKIKDGLVRLGICKKSHFISRLKEVFYRQKRFINDIELNRKFIEENVYPIFILSLTPVILNKINSNITREINNTKYIAPLRATAERYYRHQDLHVHEIDHTGSNLAIFLSRLNKNQLTNFQHWTSDNFGFKVHAGDASLHHEIKVQILDDEEEYNISDMGFGFSQILPIVASVWNETQGKNNRTKRNITFVIEQPELHLHPQFQSLLAKAFTKVIKLTNKSNTKIRILFETHSNVMIDALGEAISEGIIDKENVNIVLFEKENGITMTKVANFTEHGYLENWPIGFFSGR